MAHAGFYASFLKPRLMTLISQYKHGYDWVLRNYESEWQYKVIDYQHSQSHANWFVFRFRGRQLTKSQAKLEFYKRDADDWSGLLTNQEAKDREYPMRSDRHLKALSMLKLVNDAIATSEEDEDPTVYLSENELWVFREIEAYDGWTRVKAMPFAEEIEE